MSTRRNRSNKKKSSRQGGSAGTSTQGGTSTKTDDANNKRTHSSAFRMAACMSGLRHYRNVFPSSWRTTMTATITGQIAIGGAATRTFEVDHGGIYFPFDTSQPFPTPLVGVTAYQPAGYNALLSSTGPYVSYRTLGSAISVMITPLVTADACTVLVYPTIGGAGNFTAASQSRWVTKMEAVANERNTLTNAASIAAVSGDEPLAVATSDNFAASYNATPSLASVWEIWLNFAAVNVAAVLYTVTVVYDVVFENPEYDLKLSDEGITPRLRRSMNLLKAKSAREETGRLRALACETADDEKSGEDGLQLVSASSESSSSSSSSSAVKQAVSATKKTVAKK